MPLYFFHLRSDKDESLDHEGVELSSPEDGETIALNAARDVMCGDLRAGRLDLRMRIEIENEDGVVISAIAFADAFVHSCVARDRSV